MSNIDNECFALSSGCNPRSPQAGVAELGLLAMIVRHSKAFTSVCLASTVAALSGCISDRAAKEMGETIASPLNAIATTISGSQDLAYATAAFQRKNGRWPKDFAELSTFVQQSDGLLRLGQYDRVGFTELPGGGLEITSVFQSRTNRVTFTGKDMEAK